MNPIDRGRSRRRMSSSDCRSSFFGSIGNCGCCTSTRRSRRSSGGEPEDLIGRTALEAGVDPEQWAAFEAACAKVFATGAPGEADFAARTAQGTRYFEAHLFPEAAPRRRGVDPRHHHRSHRPQARGRLRFAKAKSAITPLHLQREELRPLRDGPARHRRPPGTKACSGCSATRAKSSRPPRPRSCFPPRTWRRVFTAMSCSSPRKMAARPTICGCFRKTARRSSPRAP